jgi:uncharacterized RDD family membrane protein YckC
MSDIWYYARGNQQMGPVPLLELRRLLWNGQVHSQDLVWHPGMPSWQHAGSVATLADVVRPSVPNFGGFTPIPPISPSPSPAYAPPGPYPATAAGYPTSPAYSAFGAAGAVGGAGMGAGAGAATMPGAPDAPNPELAASAIMEYYTPPEPTPSDLVYAGFWVRLAAWLIDLLITMILGFFIGAIIGGLIGAYMGAHGHVKPADIRAAVQWPARIAGSLITWLYFAIMESSPRQATVGKSALGLFVTDNEGRRISFARATGRYFASVISGLLLCIGYLMVAFTDRKQGLHDLMAGTLVFKRA